MKRSSTLILFLFLWMMFSSPQPASAQCAMCKAAVEAGMGQEGQEKIGAGLNKGILYLMSVPYIMGAVIAVFYFRNRKKLVDF